MPRRHSPSKRQSIIDAARALFVAKGFAAVSMDAIAAQAPVSKRTLYNHFESKEAVFGAVVAAEAEAEPSAGAQPAFDPDRALEEQLASMVAARLAELFEPSRFELLRMIIGETVRDPKLAEQFGAELDAHSDLLAPWLVSATELGYLDASEPRAASRLFWKGALGIAFWPAVLTNEPVLSPTVEDSLQRWVASFLAYVGTNNEDHR